MTGKSELQCRRISEITDEMTDKAIELYDDGKLDRFMAALEALNILLDVEFNVCERE